MSKQASLFKSFGGTVSKRVNVNVSRNSRSNDAEDIVLREVKKLLKDVVQDVASFETSKKKSVSDEGYSGLKRDKWKNKFVFWDTKDGQVIHIPYFLFLV